MTVSPTTNATPTVPPSTTTTTTSAPSTNRTEPSAATTDPLLTSTPRPYDDLNGKFNSTDITGRSLLDLLFLLGNLTLNQLKNGNFLNDNLKNLNLNLTELSFDKNVSRTIVISKETFTVPCRNEILANYNLIEYRASLRTIENEEYNQINKSNITNLAYEYDPKIGFRVRLSQNDTSIARIFRGLHVRNVECELNYSIARSEPKTTRQQFTLIYLHPRMVATPALIPTFYKLFSPNRTAVQLKHNETVRLECYAITYKEASSRYGFIWRFRTLNRGTMSQSKNYKDSQMTYPPSELINETLLDELDMKVIKSQLTIRNVDMTNSGYHWCEYDSDLVRKSYGIFVEINNVTLVRDEGTGHEEAIGNSFVKFEYTEHNAGNPLIVKSKETFYLRFKLTFNESCKVIIICLRKMQTILRSETRNFVAGTTYTFEEKSEGAETRDSGDYTLLVIKSDDQSDGVSVEPQQDQSDAPGESDQRPEIFKRLRELEFNSKSLIVIVTPEGGAELNVFRPEKYYLYNDYTAICHVFSTTPTTALTWKWSSCRTDKECDEQSPESWLPVLNNPQNSEETGNSESFFKIIAINNEQVSNTVETLSYLCNCLLAIVLGT